MRFRVFAVILTLGLLAAPVPADAQKRGKVHRIGLLTSSFAAGAQLQRVVTWLGELGYVQGENITVEGRHAAGRDERLPELAADLVRLKVDVIVTLGTPAIRAAKQATRTIPIAMIAEGDPVRAGLVTSLARPGGNITGLTALVPELSGKRLELLKEAVPGLRRVGVLWNPAHPDKRVEWRETLAAARVLEVDLQSLEVRRREDLEPTFEAATRERASALLVLADSLITSQAKRIASLAKRTRFHRAARYYYYPGWHEPGGNTEFAFNKKAYDSLPVVFQRALDYAAIATHALMVAEYETKNALALNKLRTEFKDKVEILAFPAQVMKQLRRLAREVTREQSEKSPMAKRVYASYTNVQAILGDWGRISEGAYHKLIAG
ncbi:MAG: ABC transporter substrate binding protein [Anaerolineae bacterium]